MSISVTVHPRSLQGTIGGYQFKLGSLTITGLAEGANTIPHGLPFVPLQLHLRPGASGLWGETQVPDSTNIYITVGTGGATAGTIDYEG